MKNTGKSLTSTLLSTLFVLNKGAMGKYIRRVKIELVKSVKEYVEKAREIRRKRADWNFINSQPEPIKSALIYYIETGDFRTASKLAGLQVNDFLDLAYKAKIPTVT